MGNFDEKERGSTGRTAGSAAARGVSAQQRAASERKTGKLQGNPGVFIGMEEHGNVVYARYQAIRGTWISASLAERDYKWLGPDTAFGAYLGMAVDSNLKAIKNPDHIEPGLEYLVPIRLVEKAAPPSPPSPSPPPGPQSRMVTPVLVTDKNPWTEKAKTRIPKAVAAWALKMPYPSFELDADRAPPNRAPRAAVEYWLKNHAVEIAEAERKFHVTRIAIAGAIAWEALENPQPATKSSVSVGKMHLFADPPEISWPEAIEAAGKMPKLTLEQRTVEMRKSRIGIFYIGGLLDIMCEDAEKRGFNLRGSPEVLGQMYHSRTPGEWAKFIGAKPLNEAWAMPYGAMGEWIARNIPYLESAVGKPRIP